MFSRILFTTLASAAVTLALFAGQTLATGRQGGGAAGPSAKGRRAAKLTITSVGTDGVTPAKNFHAGERVAIQLTMFNDSDEPLSIIDGDAKYQHRMKLVRDGQKVPLLPDVESAVAYKDVEGPSGSRIVRDPLQPGQSATVTLINLGEWYGGLEPGQYRLTLWYRPLGEHRTMKSNTISFQVVP